MSETDFLFARSSFTEGFARIVDLGSTLNIYNNSETVNEADLKALKNDFRMIGQDIASAVKNYGKEKKQKKS